MSTSSPYTSIPTSMKHMLAVSAMQASICACDIKKGGIQEKDGGEERVTSAAGDIMEGLGSARPTKGIRGRKQKGSG